MILHVTREKYQPHEIERIFLIQTNHEMPTLEIYNNYTV